MLGFVTLVLCNLGLILTNRSRTRSIWQSLRVPNPALWWVSGGTLFFLGLVVFVPFFRGLFRFGQIHLWEAGLVIAAALLSLLIAEVAKILVYHTGKRQRGRRRAAGRRSAVSSRKVEEEQ